MTPMNKTLLILGLAAALTHALRNNPLAARLNPDGLQIKGGRFR